jgi:hypothetical protein
MIAFPYPLTFAVGPGHDQITAIRQIAAQRQCEHLFTLRFARAVEKTSIAYKKTGDRNGL